MKRQIEQEEALNDGFAGETPDVNVHCPVEESNVTLSNDCGCVAEEVTYTHSKYCWITVSTSCVDGMVTYAQETCCPDGECGSYRTPYPGKSCKEICRYYDIPYNPTRAIPNQRK